MTTGLAAVGALAAGGALGGSGLLAAGRALAAAGGEVELVERAAELELDAQIVYETIAEGELLDEEVAAAADAFASQEADHVEALAAALEDLGGARPPSPPKPADVDGLEDAGTQSAALELAVDVENALLRAYGDVAEVAADPALLGTITEIALNAAQHLVVLRQQLGEPPLPGAFETGEPEKD